jgi:hypothetical protein
MTQYNLLKNAYLTTCVSGIGKNTVGYMAYGYGQYGTAGLTVVARDLVIPGGTYIAGIRVRDDWGTNYRIKIARRITDMTWDISRTVFPFYHIGGSSYQDYYLNDNRLIQIPDDGQVYAICCWFEVSGWHFGTVSPNPLIADMGNDYNGVYTFASTYSNRACFMPILANTRLISSQQRASIISEQPITVTSGNYIALESQFPQDYLVSSVEITPSPSVSGEVTCVYSASGILTYTSDGGSNTKTSYATWDMTSNTTPSGIVVSATSESSSSPGYYAYKALNQSNADYTDCWMSSVAPSVGTPQSLMVSFVSPAGKKINKYALLSRNHNDVTIRGFPNAWTLEGHLGLTTPSISGTSGWVVLDTRTYSGDPGQNTWTSYYTFNNSVAYRHYRIRITARYFSPNYTCIGELKLVEGQADSLAFNEQWRTLSLTWDGAKRSALLSPPVSMQTLRLFYYSTTSGTTGLTFKVNHVDSVMTISGADVPSGVDITRFSFSDTDPVIFNITNNSNVSAIPKVSLGYTGNYEIDRNIFISKDYPTSSGNDDAHWVGINSTGFMVPYRYDWTFGTFSGVDVYRRMLKLSDTTNTGTWYSPVIDTENNPACMYAYSLGNNNPTVEVKASDNAPPRAHFALITTENTHQNLMYKHKRIVFDDNGNVVDRVECNSPLTGNKIWRTADYTFAGKPLSYYATVNNHGTAAFLCPGIAACGDLDPTQEAANSDYWYNLCTRSLTSTSGWNYGTTITGMNWSPTKTVLYTRTFPLENSNGFFATTILTDRVIADSYKVYVYLSYYDGATTRLSCPIVTIKDYVFGPDDYYDIQYDYANNGWWIYLGGEIQQIYKADVGSLNSVKTFTGGNAAQGNITAKDYDFSGYLYSLDSDYNFKKLVEIPNNEFSGFWAFTASGIYLYEEDYTFGTAVLNQRCELNYSSINTTSFSELHCGSCDSLGNLWAVDIQQDRLVRVNINRVLKGIEQPIDYDNTVDGILGVVPHPTDSTAYVLISDSQDNPGLDVLRMVSAGQSVGALGKLLCEIPGFCSAPYKYGVHFTGRVYSGVHPVSSGDTMWGTGTGEWKPYLLGQPLPRGRYKQLKITFSRSSTSVTSPHLQHIRIPDPLQLEPIDRLQKLPIAIKTTLDKTKTTGDYSAELRIWWGNEEYYG